MSISVDNSLPAYSRTLAELCAQIDCEEGWCGPRTPWSKPLIENFFRILNLLLLRHLPGFDPGMAVHVRDYDPKVHGVIDMRLFIYIFHRWVLHIYHRKVVPALGCCPDEAWAEGIAKAPAGMLDSADDIDSLFSVLCVGRLDHRGVLLNAIWYSSEELRDVRMAYGAKSMRVRCKLNEDDVTVLRTEHPRDKGRWIRLQARRPCYPPGTSNHIHELVRKAVVAKGREFDENTALAELRDLTDLFSKASQIYDADRTRVLLARAEGFGSENLFDGMDLAGTLGPAKGPFTGSRLNPITEGRHAPLDAPPLSPGNSAKAPPRQAKPRKTGDTASGPGLEFDTFEVLDSVNQR